VQNFATYMRCAWIIVVGLIIVRIYYIKSVAELRNVGDTAYAINYAAAEPSATVGSGVLRVAGRCSRRQLVN